MSYRGIGVVRRLVSKLGLPGEIDGRLGLLKRHLPYHESDHVLNIDYGSRATRATIAVPAPVRVMVTMSPETATLATAASDVVAEKLRTSPSGSLK